MLRKKEKFVIVSRFYFSLIEVVATYVTTRLSYFSRIDRNKTRPNYLHLEKMPKHVPPRKQKLNAYALGIYVRYPALTSGLTALDSKVQFSVIGGYLPMHTFKVDIFHIKFYSKCSEEITQK